MNQKIIALIFIIIFFSCIRISAQSNADKEAFRSAFIQVFENRVNDFDSIIKKNVIVNGKSGFGTTINFPGTDKCFIESTLYDNKYSAVYSFSSKNEGLTFLNTLKDMLKYAAVSYKAKVVFKPQYGNEMKLWYYLADSTSFIETTNELLLEENTTKPAIGKPFILTFTISSSLQMAYYTNAGKKINNSAINSLVKEVGFGSDPTMTKIKKNKKATNGGYIYESNRTLPGYKATILDMSDTYYSENRLELVKKWKGKEEDINTKVDSLLSNINAALPASYCYRFDPDRQTVYFYFHPFATESSDAGFAISYGVNEGQKDSYFILLAITRTIEIEEETKVEEKKLYPYKHTDGKYGYKDQSGKIVVAAKYEKAEDFLKERGLVILNKKYGFIDISGKEIIPPQYDYASVFINEGLTQVRLNGKTGMINKIGKITTPIQYDEIDMGNLFYNEKGNFHPRTKFILVKQNGKYGFVDSTGKAIIPLMYDYAHIIANLVARVRLNNKEGVIDNTGKVLVPLVYDVMNTDEFSKLGVIRVMKNGKWGLVDRSGKLIIPAIYDYTSNGFYEGLAWVRLNDKAGFVDKSGKVVVPLKFNRANDFSNGFSEVWLNEKCGYIDKTGKEVIAFKYEDGRSFIQGLIAVKMNAKWGYIDKAGKEVIGFKYDKAEDFDKNGEAKVYIGKKWGRINKVGKIVDPIDNEDDNDDW